MRFLLLVVLVSGLTLVNICAEESDPLDKAFAALFKNDGTVVSDIGEAEITALSILQDAAAKGNGHALHSMGVIHANGYFGYQIDSIEAERAYRAALETDDVKDEAYLYINLAELLATYAEIPDETWIEIEALARKAYEIDKTRPGAATLLGLGKLLQPEFSPPIPEVEALLLEGLLSKPKDMRAVWFLARGYKNGWFGNPDQDAACDYYETAARADLDNAFWQTGMCYLKGTGVPQNDSIAFDWVSKSADSGYQQGLISRGVMLATGQGTKINSLLAAEAYKEAAMMDGPYKAHAMRSLGYMQISGELPETGQAAFGYALLTLADIGGDSAAKELLVEARREHLIPREDLDRELTRVRTVFKVDW